MIARAGNNGRSHGPVTVALLLSAVVLAALPLLTGLRAALDGWVPAGDPAHITLQAHDVLSTDPPALGMPSTASEAAGRVVHHPGPLQFDAMALPVRFLGRGAGAALGTAAVNAAAAVLLVVLVRRSFGRGAGLLAATGTATLMWSLGTENLFDPWPLHATLLPFALFLVAAWCALAGDSAAPPILVVAGSYTAQTHLSYGVVVPAVVLLVTAVLVRRVLRARRSPPHTDARPGVGGWPGRRSRALRIAGVSAALGLLCWARPLAEQLAGGRTGNLWGLRGAGTDASTISAAAALRVVGGTLAVPPAWLPPSFRDPPLDPDGTGLPLPLAVGGLLGLTALLAWAGRRARARGSTGVAAGALVGLATVVLALITASRMPDTFGARPGYVRWLWPMGMVLWLVLAIALLAELRDRPGVAAVIAAPRKAAVMAGGLLAVVVLLAVITPPVRATESMAFHWAGDAADAVRDPLLTAVEDAEGPVIIDVQASWVSILLAPTIAGLLQQEGIDFASHEVVIGRQLGPERYVPLGEASGSTRVALRHGEPDPAPGEEIVTTWDGLSAGERAEFDRLTADLADAIDEHGLRLVDDAESTLEALGQEEVLQLVEEPPEDPEALLADSRTWQLATETAISLVPPRLIDDSSYPPGLVDRWAELARRDAFEHVTVYTSPMP